ncbi:MAG TPA: methyl-accepting chemotaxis protein, partial [Desulfuromonadales bacterium]|nr:methyl-accepting chemotaxis protein [Desulfuromonadales bacterium]
ATYRKNKTISITAMLLGIVMGAFFSFGIVRSITRPLTTGVELADRLANGDLTAEITVRGSDETGHLMTALKSMSDSLRIIINQISRTSSELASSAQQLSLTADHISTGTEKVSIQVGTVATAGEQMSATSADIARNCQMAAEGAQQAALTAINSAEVVRKTLAVMEKVAMQVHSSARSIEQLGTHSVQIGAIVDTIKDIADQTNLLALNAAIEAARAGDQGRGFAVVADEVRALSTRTTKATQEIGGMIKTIQKETEEAIRIMEQGVLQVETGTLEAARSGEALQEILAKVNDVVMQVNQIATAVEQQSATTREISGNMLHVTEVVRQTSQDAEESAAMATQLNVNAKELQRLVQQFRL